MQIEDVQISMNTHFIPKKLWSTTPHPSSHVMVPGYLNPEMHLGLSQYCTSII